MKTSLRLPLLFSVLLFGLMACQKDKDTPNEEPSAAEREAIIINGGWAIESAVYKDGIEVYDEHALRPDCELDDSIHFLVDKRYQMVEGPTKCDPNDPDIKETGTWSISSDGKQLLLDGEAMNIISLNSDKMVLQASYPDDNATFTFTFIRGKAQMGSEEKALIQKAPYKLVSLVETYNGQSVDYLESADDCEKDNIYDFKENHVMEVLSGALKCDPNETDPIEVMSWAYVHSTQQFYAFDEAYTLMELSENRLVFGYEVKDASTGNTGSYIFTFTR